MKQELEGENGSGMPGGRIPHPFKAPEGYFEKLNDEIHSRIAAVENRTVRVSFSFNWKLVPVLAGVALVVFLVLKKDNGEQYVALNYDELYASGLVAFDESTLAEYIDMPADTGSEAEELYIIESMNEEALISEL